MSNTKKGEGHEEINCLWSLYQCHPALVNGPLCVSFLLDFDRGLQIPASYHCHPASVVATGSNHGKLFQALGAKPCLAMALELSIYITSDHDFSLRHLLIGRLRSG